MNAIAARSDKTKNEIIIQRVYDAPVKAVWEAWTDPAKAALWWGPRGFSITTHSKDLRVGGSWSYIMHGPDGIDYPNKTLYLEVEEYKKLVYDHGGNDERPPMFRVTVLFSEKNGKTTMQMTMMFPTSEIAEQTKIHIKKMGGNATWDRLAEYLDLNLFGKDRFTINWSFDASVDVIYDRWSKSEHLAKWLAPAGFSTEYYRSEMKEGKSLFYKMSNRKGVSMYGRSHYMQLSRPHRIVYTQEFCDEQENLSRHPMAPVWPATMLVIVMFTEEGAGCTRVTLTTEIYGEATKEERLAFNEAKSGMTLGWSGSFEKLERNLA